MEQLSSIRMELLLIRVQIQALLELIVLIIGTNAFGDVDTATVCITVGTPSITAVDDVYSGVCCDTLITTVLTNDMNYPAGTIPSVLDSTDHGTLIVNADGTIGYIPMSGFEGVDSFTYVICDGSVCDTALVTITINGGTPPVIVDSTGTPIVDTMEVVVPEDSTVSICGIVRC